MYTSSGIVEEKDVESVNDQNVKGQNVDLMIQKFAIADYNISIDLEYGYDMLMEYGGSRLDQVGQGSGVSYLGENTKQDRISTVHYNYY